MNKTRDKVSGAASNMRPYVERAVSDAELRDNVRAAFQAAREVYDELMGNRSVTTVASRVATDRDIQDKLKEAVDELRQAADRVQGKREHTARNTMLLLVGIALGVLFNPVTGPTTRKWVADMVFGKDDFTYEGSGGDGSSGSAPV
jgi:predicted RNA-binding protein